MVGLFVIDACVDKPCAIRGVLCVKCSECAFCLVYETLSALCDTTEPISGCAARDNVPVACNAKTRRPEDHPTGLCVPMIVAQFRAAMDEVCGMVQMQVYREKIVADRIDDASDNQRQTMPEYM